MVIIVKKASGASKKKIVINKKKSVSGIVSGSVCGDDSNFVCEVKGGGVEQSSIEKNGMEVSKNVKKRKRSEYHIFMEKRMSELEENESSVSKADRYKMVRDEWKKIKEEREKGKVKRGRGRPKKIVEEGDNVNCQGEGVKKRGRPRKNKEEKDSKLPKRGRGRPPKNPLKLFLGEYELWKSKNFVEFNEIEVDEDEKKICWNEEVYIKLVENREELEKILVEKNKPKGKRGRPKGSKNKTKVTNNDEEKEEKKESDEAEYSVIDTSDFVIGDNIFGEIGISEEENVGIE